MTDANFLDVNWVLFIITYRLIDGSVASYISVLYLNVHQSVATYIIQEAPYIYLNLQQSAPLTLSVPHLSALSLPCLSFSLKQQRPACPVLSPLNQELIPSSASPSSATM